MTLSNKTFALAACAAALIAGPSAFAAPAKPAAAAAPAPPAEVHWVRSISFALAKEAADAALKCAADGGSNTSVGVMDISGHFKVLYTPDNATLVGYDVLIKKMNAALLLQQDTSPEFKKVQRPARAETGTLSNVLDRIAPGMALISPGGLPIFAGKDFIGVIGVAGATTPGDLDTKCPQVGLDAIKDRLN
jgi:uncharacterized protein GlcG (DUF336 family)